MRFCRVFDDFGGGADAPQPAAKALRRIAERQPAEQHPAAQHPAALPPVVVDLGRVAERAAQAVADIQARAHTWGLRSAAAQPEPKGAAALFAPVQRGTLAVTPVSPNAGEVFRLYVSAGARPVAVRSIAAGGATSVQYLHPDHLGSIGQITDANRNWVQDVYFKPYGGVRWAQSGILGPDSDSATRRSYTGQYEETSQLLGSLMHYKARYYSPFLHRFTQPDTIVPEPGNPQDLNRFAYSLSNPINYTDPTGHSPNPSCSGNPTPDCGVDNTPAPPAPIVPGYRATLIAPGTGQVTMYNYPVYNDESLSRPEDLDPTQQKAGRLQGSVKINGQNWNYICTGGDNCPSGYWQENDFPCAYASATQCLTPLNSRAPNRTTGAAQTNATGRIPVSSTQLIIIQAPGAPASSPFQRPVIIKSQDGCPGCDPLQVDIFSPHETIQSLNTRNGLNTPVYIWRLDVIVPSNDIYDWGRGGVR